MAIPIASILKNLAPLVLDATRLLVGVRSSDANMKSEERIGTLEEEVGRLAAVTAKLAEQTQAIAEQLRAQEAVNAAQEKKLRILLMLSIAASLISISALVVALTR